MRASEASSVITDDVAVIHKEGKIESQTKTLKN